MTEKEYRELQYPGYSILSKLAYHPRAAKDAIDGEKKKTRSLDLGSLVDTMLTSPSTFEENYHVISGNLPSNSYMTLVREYISIVERMIEELGSREMIDDNQVILSARTAVGFQSNWKDETVIANFHKECDNYLNQYLAAEGKVIITETDKSFAEKLCAEVLSNDFTKKYFEKADGIEILYQTPIVFEIEGRTLKSLPDIIYIDHNNKSVEVVDIKTFSESFIKNYYKYRYYYQGAIYSFAAASLLKERGVLDEYKIELFRFLTIDTTEFEPPTIYMMPQQDVEAATWGGNISNRPVDGWIQLLHNFYWHLENDRWDYPIEVYKTGVKMINP